MLARRRDKFLVRALSLVATIYLEMVANVCYEIDLNGELGVLQTLAEFAPSCIFDVGANVGDWSIAAASQLPGCQIHAFEIVPDTAFVMQKKLDESGLSSVTLNPIGLSDENATVEVAFLPGFSQGSSAAVVASTDVQFRKCQVQTGDEYCSQREIDRIDLLKIDVEGLEGKVLEGFAGMLSGARIDAVQFEYGRVNAMVRFLLGDFYDLLGGYGYVVGKVFPEGVDFRAYEPLRHEDFRGAIYLAVHRSRPDLITRLSTHADADLDRPAV